MTIEANEVMLEAMRAKLAALEAENAALRAAATGKLTLRVSKSGAVSVYGMGRWPVTLYSGQWAKVFAAKAQIEAFILANKAILATKERDDLAPSSVQSLSEFQEAQAAGGHNA